LSGTFFLNNLRHASRICPGFPRVHKGITNVKHKFSFRWVLKHQHPLELNLDTRNMKAALRPKRQNAVNVTRCNDVEN